MGKKSRRQKSKEVNSSSNRNTLVVGVILIAVVGYWGINQLGGSGFPKLVSGVFYDSVTVTADGKVSVPQEVLDNSKLVFVDVKLENATDEFNYLGRRIILSGYKVGEYLPLILISTPKGNTIGGVRVCEPCSSFSFHIVDGKYLQCDACGTRWDIETLQGISGGCISYPPPKLTTGLLNGVTVETSPTGLSLA